MKKLMKTFVPILLVYTTSAIADHHDNHRNIFPTITSVHANNCFETNICEENHDILTVKINTNVRNAQKIKISENEDFSGAEWIPYSNSIEFKLSPGYEEKTLYVQVGKQITLREPFSRIMSSKVKKIKYQPKGTLYFASLGDSYASGEGAPAVERTTENDQLRDESELWNLGDHAPQCHRSTFNARNLTVNKIRREIHAISRGNVKVVFKDLSCSGATINVGLLGPYAGKPRNKVSRHVLEPQVDELENWLNSIPQDKEDPIKLDVLFLSIGGNDAGFAHIITDCAAQGPTGKCNENEGTAHTVHNGRIGTLTSATGLGELSYNLRRLKRDLPKNIKKIYMTAYPDITRDHNGRHEDYTSSNTCINDDFKIRPEHLTWGTIQEKEWHQILAAEIDNIHKDELAWISTFMITPLNNEIKEFTEQNEKWEFIDEIETMALTHGLCVLNSQGERWFNTFQESFRKQGDVSGAVHPNRKGYNEMSKIIYDEIKSDFHL